MSGRYEVNNGDLFREAATPGFGIAYQTAFLIGAAGWSRASWYACEPTMTGANSVFMPCIRIAHTFPAGCGHFWIISGLISLSPEVLSTVSANGWIVSHGTS